MQKEENISRRDALKRMSKTALAVAAATVLPRMNAMANSITHQAYVDKTYVDRCYSDYENYNNYQNHNDYHNYGNYKNYYNYNDYSNYHNYQNYSDVK